MSRLPAGSRQLKFANSPSSTEILPVPVVVVMVVTPPVMMMVVVPPVMMMVMVMMMPLRDLVLPGLRLRALGIRRPSSFQQGDCVWDWPQQLRVRPRGRDFGRVRRRRRLHRGHRRNRGDCAQKAYDPLVHVNFPTPKISFLGASARTTESKMPFWIREHGTARRAVANYVTSATLC